MSPLTALPIVSKITGVTYEDTMVRRIQAEVYAVHRCPDGGSVCGRASKGRLAYRPACRSSGDGGWAHRYATPPNVYPND